LAIPSSITHSVRDGSDVARSDLDFYGLGVTISGDWPEVITSLSLDFAWFEQTDPAADSDVAVTIERRPPDLDALGDLPASFVTPRNVVYQDGARTVVEYVGQAVSILDRDSGRLVVQGETKHVVHEAVYQFVLSRVGQHLDTRRLPRLHGLGLVGAAGAVVVMLPSGGGKTTLALHALRSRGPKLLSEDSPLIDWRGRVHPFPLRIGINPGDADPAEEQALRRIERLEFHTKLALEISSFRNQIAAMPAPLRHLVIGHRSLGRNARLDRAPRRSAVEPLIREAVVGVGLYQGMEFVLQRGMRDVFGHAGTALARGLCCAAALARANVWRLEIGRDQERNWAALEPLVRSTAAANSKGSR
jgi:hypothetical protein